MTLIMHLLESSWNSINYLFVKQISLIMVRNHNTWSPNNIMEERGKPHEARP